MTVATAAALTCVMPAFLLGAAAVFVRADLGVDASTTGFAFGAFFGCTAAASVAGGAMAERLGPRRGLLMVATMNVIALLSVAVAVHGPVTLVLVMAVAGAGNGAGQPVTNLVLARAPGGNKGLLFGVKQSAVPGAAIVAGSLVPGIGQWLGWRWVFVFGACMAAVIGFLARNVGESLSGHVDGPGRPGRSDVGRRPLAALSLAIGIGAAAGTCAGMFLVDSVAASGHSVEVAGLLLTAGGLVGVAARVSAGWGVDRGWGQPLIVVAGMLAIGAAGFVLLAQDELMMLVIGTLLATSIGWGWSGLLLHAAVELSPNTPGAATAIVTAGAAAGATIGPLLFGVVVDRNGFASAWLLMGGSSLVSALLVLMTRTWLHADIGRGHDQQ